MKISSVWDFEAGYNYDEDWINTVYSWIIRDYDHIRKNEYRSTIAIL